MPRYVKNEKGYKKSFDADWKAVKKGLKKVRSEQGEPKKVPTSVALDPRFIAELKKAAAELGKNFCSHSVWPTGTMGRQLEQGTHSDTIKRPLGGKNGTRKIDCLAFLDLV